MYISRLPSEQPQQTGILTYRTRWLAPAIALPDSLNSITKRIS